MIRQAIAVLAALAIPVGLAVGCGVGRGHAGTTSTNAKTASAYSLVFLAKDYTAETITVDSKKITYHFYTSIRSSCMSPTRWARPTRALTWSCR